MDDTILSDHKPALWTGLEEAFRASPQQQVGRDPGGMLQWPCGLVLAIWDDTNTQQQVGWLSRLRVSANLCAGQQSHMVSCKARKHQSRSRLPAHVCTSGWYTACLGCRGGEAPTVCRLCPPGRYATRRQLAAGQLQLQDLLPLLLTRRLWTRVTCSRGLTLAGK